MPIDELEFYRILQLFPVVRSRDYHVDMKTSSRSASSSAVNRQESEGVSLAPSNKDSYDGTSNQHDAFWEKLKLAAEKKVGPAEAENFCKAFQKVYKKLVYEDMSLESARTFLNSTS